MCVLEALSALGETEPATRDFAPGFNRDAVRLPRTETVKRLAPHDTGVDGKDSHAAGRGANDAIWATFPRKCESAV